MAWTFQLNTFPATGGEALWYLKEFLVSQGWDVPRSGDGTGGNYNPAGDVHAPGGLYAGSLDLATAWMELRQPATATPQRSFMFFVPSVAGSVWQIWYSSDGTGFTTGGSASVRSTAADEQGIINTPSGGTQWLPNNNSYRMDVAAGGSSEGHGFFFGTRVADPTGGYAGVLSLDVLEESDPADTDPAVIGTNFINDTRFALSFSPFYNAVNTSQNTGVSMGWYQKGLGSPNFVPYPAAFLGGFEGSGSSLAPLNADRISQKTDNSFVDFPIWYWRGGPTHTTERGKKGRSTLYRASQPRFGVFRPNNALTQMSVGALSIPWDGSTIPIF